MSNDPKNKKQDRLGEFLTKYDEYLDGKRSYSDLPTFAVCTDTATATATATNPTTESVKK